MSALLFPEGRQALSLQHQNLQQQLMLGFFQHFFAFIIFLLSILLVKILIITNTFSLVMAATGSRSRRRALDNDLHLRCSIIALKIFFFDGTKAIAIGNIIGIFS